MFRLPGARTFVCALGIFGILVGTANAQYGGGTGPGAGAGATGSTSTSTSAANVFHNNYHIGFERPEAWGLKYFASDTLLSGLPVPAPSEAYRAGSITVSLEMDWLPQLDAGQQHIGFNGTTPEDLNKAPILARPIVRIGLPDKFSVLLAAPPPFEMFGVRAHLLAFGLERPLVERERWVLAWRGYGQVGSVKGAFTCPNSVLALPPGSPNNPTDCVGESADVSRLRYAGSELEFSYRIPGHPKIIPHFAAGGNFIDGVFQTGAPVRDGFDQTRMWTRGGTFSGTAGITYMITKRVSFGTDVFYTPLWVERSATAPRTNDGLFNVRALLSYSFR